jgi:hypothetical protein
MVKPQLIISAQGKKKIQLIIKGGSVCDVIKHSCPDIEIEFHDYDTTFVFDEDEISLDDRGREYQLTIV